MKLCCYAETIAIAAANELEMHMSGEFRYSGRGGAIVNVVVVPQGLHGVAHTCATTTGGAIYCWGANGYGQLGDGTFDAQYQPEQIGGAFVWNQPSAGTYSSCSRRNPA